MCGNLEPMTNVRSRIYKAIETGEPRSIRDLAEQADCSIGRAHDIVTELIRAGTVRHTPARYELTDR